MKIVGVGCGSGMLTEDAIEVISSAKSVYGSKRALNLAEKYFSSDADVNLIEDYKALKSLSDDAVVLSTGDPLMAGLGYLSGEIISGISSMQTAFARLHTSWTNVSVVNAHNKNHDEAILRVSRDIEAGHSVFIIADPDFSVTKLAKSLPPETKIAVCSDLGYENESVCEGTALNPPLVSSRLFCVVCGY